MPKGQNKSTQKRLTKKECEVFIGRQLCFFFWSNLIQDWSTFTFKKRCCFLSITHKKRRYNFMKFFVKWVRDNFSAKNVNCAGLDMIRHRSGNRHFIANI